MELQTKIQDGGICPKGQAPFLGKSKPGAHLWAIIIRRCRHFLFVSLLIDFSIEFTQFYFTLKTMFFSYVKRVGDNDALKNCR